jgi:hypothetical protein
MAIDWLITREKPGVARLQNAVGVASGLNESAKPAAMLPTIC